MVTMMNDVYVSLEELLSPIGEPEGPAVGLVVDDWDDNLRSVGIKVVDAGYALQVIERGEYSAEAMVARGMSQTFFYGDDVGDLGIPVLKVDQGNVIVTEDGVERELEHYLTGI